MKRTIIMSESRVSVLKRQLYSVYWACVKDAMIQLWGHILWCLYRQEQNGNNIKTQSNTVSTANYRLTNSQRWIIIYFATKTAFSGGLFSRIALYDAGIAVCVKYIRVSVSCYIHVSLPKIDTVYHRWYLAWFPAPL